MRDADSALPGAGALPALRRRASRLEQPSCAAKAITNEVAMQTSASQYKSFFTAGY